MTVDASRARRLLAEFQFEPLFIEELGWDRYGGHLEVAVAGSTYQLEGVAEKRGMVAFVVQGGDGVPDRQLRRRIERQAAHSVHEHLIVYVDAEHTAQVWQWVKREPGKPIAVREHPYRRGQPGDSLIQKLEAVAFSLDEEARLSLIDVTRRARRAFDVERVTKRFYERFKDEHDTFMSFISGLTNVADLEWYASVTLNRLMFIYFIQKKGFLDDDRDYLRTRLQRSQAEAGPDQFHTFYRHFLLRLFHEGLGSRARSAELDELIGRVPYLNGGLFDVHELERLHPEIQIPDDAFARLFDFFDSYQWHLDDRPLRADNEVNPDVLGYIFEKYVNQKQMGAYYTKEDITGYITTNTIIPAILDALDAAGQLTNSYVAELLRADPDRYITPDIHHGTDLELPAEVEAGITDPTARGHWNALADGRFALPGETWRDVVRRRRHYRELVEAISSLRADSKPDFVRLNIDLAQLAQDAVESAEGTPAIRAIFEAISTLSVLDPTCGSGAFLFAALNVLEPLYETTIDRMESLAAEGADGAAESFGQLLSRVREHPNRTFFILKTVAVNNLFGVDIMEEAAEICKLRLFLKLVSQVSRLEDLEPLPDIDFNVRAGNSLVGFAAREELVAASERILDLGGVLGDVERQLSEIDELSQEFRRAQTDGEDAQAKPQKKKLEEALQALTVLLDEYLAADYGVLPAKAGTPAFEAWRASHLPFHWFVDFHQIMERGGFDAIVGNPPYVEFRLVRDIYTLPRGIYETEPVANLYAFCMERSARLLNSRGRYGMIVPAGVLGLDEALPLREVLLRSFETSHCSTYAIRPSKLFDGVDQRLCIYLGRAAAGGDDGAIFTTQYQHWKAEERPALFHKLQYEPSFLNRRLKRIPQLGSPEAVGVVEKLETHRGKCVQDFYDPVGRGALLHYHRSPRYWIRAMDFEPYFKSETRSRSVHHFRDLHFRTTEEAKAIGAILNSTLFFFWFTAIGNGRNITGSDVQLFPIGDLSSDVCASLGEVFDRLMQDYQTNSFVRVRKDAEFQEFRPSLSKPIIDEIDELLAVHYDFSPNEADFIKNLDIKYRLGADEEE